MNQYPALLSQAGLDPETLLRIDHLVVGCGGFVKELISFTAGASEIKDNSGQRLSAADCLVDRLLREQLTTLVEGSSGYSEEGGAFGCPQPGRVRWLIDPVDGTRPATLGGAFAVSVAAMILDPPEALGAVGWVYVPTLSVLYRGVVVPHFTECLLNEEPVGAETGITEEDLCRRYVAVSSDWHSLSVSRCPLKLSAPGATAVHLTQLVHRGSDVVAAALTRYRSYDAAAGLIVAAAGGCRIYPLGEQTGVPMPAARALWPFLAEASAAPEAAGPRVIICTPEVAAAWRRNGKESAVNERE